MVLIERFNEGPMESIERLWWRIENWMQRHAPERWQQLAPGATEEALHRLETILDITLPDDVRASYRRHDGGYTMKPVTSMRILSIKSIIDYWHMLMELLDDEEWASQPIYHFTDERLLRSGWHPGPIQQAWWHKRWVPFAEDNAGNLCCLDLAPAPGGVVGQILDWDHECGPSCTDFPSFRHLLSAFVDQLEDISKEESQ